MYTVHICLPHGQDVGAAAALIDDIGIMVQSITQTAYRRQDMPDMDIVECSSSMRPTDAAHKAIEVLREKGYRAYRFIPRSGDRKKPAASPKLKLTPQELNRAIVAATLDGIKPTGRSGGLPELVVYFIQLMNDRYEELAKIYGEEHLKRLDPETAMNELVSA